MVFGDFQCRAVLEGARATVLVVGADRGFLARMYEYTGKTIALGIGGALALAKCLSVYFYMRDKALSGKVSSTRAGLVFLSLIISFSSPSH